MGKQELKRKDLIYPELSYQIVGVLFSVGTEFGYSHKESFYQKAIVEGLRLAGLKFQEQTPARLYYQGKFIGIYYFDFLIENKIILEIKAKSHFSLKDISQLYSYLKAQKLKLGLLAYFTKSGVRFKRVVNL